MWVFVAATLVAFDMEGPVRRPVAMQTNATGRHVLFWKQPPQATWEACVESAARNLWHLLDSDGFRPAMPPAPVIVCKQVT